jgi:hypothetical protein
VRFVCVDLVGFDDHVVGVAIARARELAADAGRILLFGAAARLASRRHRQAREVREGAWLDATAQWLVHDDATLVDAPARPVADVFDERAVAVLPARGEALSLPVTDRFLELVDGLVVMGVAGDHAVDAVDNAHLWLIGGGAFSVEPRGGGRALVRVGGKVVVVNVEGGEALVAAYPPEGGAAVTHVVALVSTTKFAVRGGGRQA